MKKFLPLILILASTSLYAGNDYEMAIRRDKMCKSFGELTALGAGYRDKKITREDFLNLPAVTLWPEPFHQLLVDGFDSSDSVKDAYMIGWAKCQDKYSN